MVFVRFWGQRTILEAGAPQAAVATCSDVNKDLSTKDQDQDQDFYSRTRTRTRTCLNP